MNILHYLKQLKRSAEFLNFKLFPTLYVNFRLLPIKQAYKLPIVIYNKTQFKISRSNVRLNIPAHFGLLKWGFQNDWQLSTHTPSLWVMINGVIEINGSVVIAPGTTLRIHEGCVNLGDGVFIGGGKDIK